MSPLRPRHVSHTILALAALLVAFSPAVADPCLLLDLGELGWIQFFGEGIHGYQAYYGPYWVIVAGRGYPGSGCDVDLEAYRYWDGGTYPDCASAELASSQAEGDVIDFVVGDFNHNPSDTTFYHLFCYGGGSQGINITSDAHPEQLTVGDPAVSGSFDQNEFARMWDVYLEVGETYAFDLNATTSAIRMAFFASDGSEYWNSRGDGVWDTPGDTLWTAPATDWYGLAVYADHGITGSYDIRVGHSCDNIALVEGVLQSVPESSYFRYTQTEPHWNVIGTRSPDGTGEGDLWQVQYWLEEGVHPDCIDGFLSGSAEPGDVTNFVVSDFNHNTPGTYYLMANWEDGPSYDIAWDGDGSEITPRDPPSSYPGIPNQVAEIWDVELLAGQEYMFEFSPSRPDLRMALFGNQYPGTPRWSGRGEWEWSSTSTIVWTPPETDVYGLLVYGEGAGSDGAFDLGVTYACSYDELYDGVTTSISSENDTYLRFDPTLPDWGVVGVRPSVGSGNADMTVYKAWTNWYWPDCADTMVGGSYASGEAVDFVVGDFWDAGAGDYYVLVDWTGEGGGEYQAQYNESAEYVGSGWSDSVEVYDSFVADIQTALLIEGQEYTFYFDPSGADLRMALFDQPAPGTVSSRADAVWDVDWTTTWTAPATALYAIVVYNESGGTGGYEIAIGPPCEYTEMGDGSTYWNEEGGYYGFTPTVQTFSVVAAQNRGSAGDPNLYAAGAWNGDLTPPHCLTWPQVWSEQPGSDMDFMVADFHQMALEQQHVEFRWAELPDEYGDISWKQSWGTLDVGVDVIDQSVTYLWMAVVWDVYLEAGTEYLFEFDPRGGSEVRMALFGGSRFAWWNRAGAVWDAVGDIVWTPSETGWYGLVVYNEGGSDGHFSLGMHDTPVDSFFYAELVDPTTALVRWSVPPTAGLAGVNLYRALLEGGAYVRVNDGPLSLSPEEAYQDAGLWPDTDYVYELRTVSHDGSESAIEGPPATVRTGGASTAALLGVGPNPLVGETTIHYYVPEPGASASLKLINSRGAEVRTLLDQPRHTPGTRAVTWNGLDDNGAPVSSGVYFYELVIGAWRHTGKMVVIR